MKRLHMELYRSPYQEIRWSVSRDRFMCQEERLKQLFCDLIRCDLPRSNKIGGLLSRCYDILFATVADRH